MADAALLQRLIAYWLVCTATIGMQYAFGSLYVVVLDSFESSRGEAALVGALCAGLMDGLAAMSGVIVQRIGSRAACIVGEPMRCTIDAARGRIMVTATGQVMPLFMSSQKLGFLKVRPVVDAAVIARARTAASAQQAHSLVLCLTRSVRRMLVVSPLVMVTQRSSREAVTSTCMNAMAVMAVVKSRCGG